MNIVEETELVWLKDELTTQTNLSELLENEESGQIATVIIFVISAILVIALIFVIAIFIDCRQQKLQNLDRRKRKIVKIKTSVVPKIGKAVPKEDKKVLTENMCEGEPPSLNNIV